MVLLSPLLRFAHANPCLSWIMVNFPNSVKVGAPGFLNVYFCMVEVVSGVEVEALAALVVTGVALPLAALPDFDILTEVWQSYVCNKSSCYSPVQSV